VCGFPLFNPEKQQRFMRGAFQSLFLCIFVRMEWVCVCVCAYFLPCFIHYNHYEAPHRRWCLTTRNLFTKVVGRSFIPLKTQIYQQRLISDHYSSIAQIISCPEKSKFLHFQHQRLRRAGTSLRVVISTLCTLGGHLFLSKFKFINSVS